MSIYCGEYSVPLEEGAGLEELWGEPGTWSERLSSWPHVHHSLSPPLLLPAHGQNRLEQPNKIGDLSLKEQQYWTTLEEVAIGLND